VRSWAPRQRSAPDIIYRKAPAIIDIRRDSTCLSTLAVATEQFCRPVRSGPATNLIGLNRFKKRLTRVAADIAMLPDLLNP
jgi:hypothetical protein